MDVGKRRKGYIKEAAKGKKKDKKDIKGEAEENEEEMETRKVAHSSAYQIKQVRARRRA